MGIFSLIIFGNVVENFRVLFMFLLQNEDNFSYYYVGVESISVGNWCVLIFFLVFWIDVNGVGGVILDLGIIIIYW